MSSAGSPDSETETRPARRLPCLAGLLLLLLATLVIGWQVFSVFYAILFPPMPFVPSAARELSHESSQPGVDRWLYMLDQPGCAVLNEYAVRGLECRILPDCVSQGEMPMAMTTECRGSAEFSIFAMRWTATISPAERSEQTMLQLEREILWFGVHGPQDE